MEPKVLDNLEQDYSFQLSLLCLMTVPHQAQGDRTQQMVGRGESGQQAGDGR